MIVVIYTPQSQQDDLGALFEQSKIMERFRGMRESLGFSFDVPYKELGRFSNELKNMKIKHLLVRCIIEDLTTGDFERVAKTLVNHKHTETWYSKLWRVYFEK